MNKQFATGFGIAAVLGLVVGAALVKYGEGSGSPPQGSSAAWGLSTQPVSLLSTDAQTSRGAQCSARSGSGGAGLGRGGRHGLQSGQSTGSGCGQRSATRGLSSTGCGHAEAGVLGSGGACAQASRSSGDRGPVAARGCDLRGDRAVLDTHAATAAKGCDAGSCERQTLQTDGPAASCNRKTDSATPTEASDSRPGSGHGPGLGGWGPGRRWLMELETSAEEGKASQPDDEVAEAEPTRPRADRAGLVANRRVRRTPVQVVVHAPSIVEGRAIACVRDL